MAQRIECPGNDLHARNAHRISGIQHSKGRRESCHSCFQMQIFIGDDGTAVHLRTSTGSSNDRADRDGFCRKLVRSEFHFPDILFQLCLRRDDLAAVDHAAAAHGQDEIGLIFFGQPRAFLHFGIRRVRHDAGELDDILAIFLQRLHHFIIDAVFLDGSAAISEHDIGAALGQLLSSCFF